MVFIKWVWRYFGRCYLHIWVYLGSCVEETLLTAGPSSCSACRRCWVPAAVCFLSSCQWDTELTGSSASRELCSTSTSSVHRPWILVPGLLCLMLCGWNVLFVLESGAWLGLACVPEHNHHAVIWHTRTHTAATAKTHRTGTTCWWCNVETKSNMELPYGVWKNTKVEFILICPTLVSEWRWNWRTRIRVKFVNFGAFSSSVRSPDQWNWSGLSSQSSPAPSMRGWRRQRRAAHWCVCLCGVCVCVDVVVTLRSSILLAH